MYSAELGNRVDDPKASDSSLQINEEATGSENDKSNEAFSQTVGVHQVKRLKNLRATKSWVLKMLSPQLGNPRWVTAFFSSFNLNHVALYSCEFVTKEW